MGHSDCADDQNNILKQVALGGGKRYFRPNTTVDEIAGTSNNRRDGQDFVSMWQSTVETSGERAKYVITRDELNEIDANEVDHLWGR